LWAHRTVKANANVTLQTVSILFEVTYILKNPNTQQLYTYYESGVSTSSIFKEFTPYYSLVYWHSQFDTKDQEGCLDDAYDEFWDAWGEKNAMNDDDIKREVKKCFDPNGSYIFKVVEVQPFVPIENW
jgi:hypothetical protein